MQIDRDQKAKWYVVYCNSGQEDTVSGLIKIRAQNAGLSDQIQDFLVPTVEKITIRKGEKKTVKEKVYKGYIFIKMVLNDQTWPLVKDTPGVIRFAGTGKEPTPIPESEIKAIKEISGQQFSSYKLNISEGDKVKITSGDFKDFTGTVTKIDYESGKVTVNVIFLNREVPVELDVTHIVHQ